MSVFDIGTLLGSLDFDYAGSTAIQSATKELADLSKSLDQAGAAGTALDKVAQGMNDAAKAAQNLKLGGVASDVKALGEAAEGTVGKLAALQSKLTQFVTATANSGSVAAGFLETFGEAGIAAVEMGAAVAGVVGIVGMAGRAAFEFAERTSEADAALGDLHDKIGMSVPALSRLDTALHAAGGNTVQFTSAMFQLERGLATGSKAVDEGLKRLGTSADEFKQLGVDEYAGELAKRFAALESPTAKAAAAAELFGMRGKDLLPTMEKLNKALEDTASINPLTSEQAEAAAKFQDQLTLLSVSSHALATEIGRELLPAAQLLLDVFKDYGGPALKLLGYITGFTPTIYALGKAWEYAAASANAYFNRAGSMLPKPSEGGSAERGLQTAQAALDKYAAGGMESPGDAAKEMARREKEVAAVNKEAAREAKEAAKAAAEYALALGRIEVAGGNLQPILDSMDGEVHEGVKYYLEAGAAQGDLAKMYGLTAIQVMAVAKEIKNEKDALKAAEEAEKQQEKLMKEINASMEESEKASEQAGAAIAKAFGGQQVLINLARMNSEFDEMGGLISGKLLAGFDTLSGKMHIGQLMADGMTQANEAVRKAGEEMAKSFIPLTSAQQDVIDKLHELGHTAEQIAAETGMSVIAIANYTGEAAARNIQNMVTALSQMAQIAGGSGSSIGKALGLFGQIAGGVNLMNQNGGGNALTKGMGKVLGNSKVSGAVMNYGGAVMSGLNAKTGGTDEQGNPTTFAETMNSAMDWKSPQTYMMAAGTMGISLGVQAAIGGIKYLFRDRTLEDAARDAGERFGTKFSKATMDAIQEAKDKGARVIVAEQLNFDSIIKDAGGLNSGNMDRFAQQFRDTFAMLGQHWMSVANATEIVDKNWQEFVKAGTDGAGRLNAKLKEMIQLDQTFGTHSKEIAAYLSQQGDAAVSAIDAIVAGSADAINNWTSIGQKVGDAKDALSKAAEGTEEWKKASDDLAAALEDQQKNASGAKQELDDLGVEAVAAFSAAVASGMTFPQALAKIHNSLAQLRQSYKDLGLGIDDAALKNLTMQDAVLNASPALMNAVAGLSQEMVALDNMGLMNSTTFASMERTGVQAYTRLQAQVAELGGETKDALLPMQDYLHQAVIEAKLLNEPLDDATAELVRQSRELGIWKEAGKSATEQLTDSMTKLVDKVAELIDQLRGIPPKISTQVDVTTGPGTDGAIDAAGGGGDAMSTGADSPYGIMDPGVATPDNTYFAKGGMPKPRGGDVYPVMVSGGEEVITPSSRGSIEASIKQLAGSIGAGGGDMTIPIQVTVNMGGKSLGSAARDVFLPGVKRALRESGSEKKEMQVLLEIA